jgi:Methyltransferase domain
MANNNSLDEYLKLCAQFANIDIDTARRETLAAIKRHDKKQFDPLDTVQMTSLETKWYRSLENAPDYSVYADPYYFCETWLCWIKYSKRYLKDIQSTRSMFGKSIVESMIGIDTVLDLGCGAGYTTMELTKIFSKAKVYGTNFEGSSQYAMSSHIGNTQGFEMQGSHKDIKADLIFASEYFEHFERPIEHLVQVIEHCNPKYMLIANTFTSMAIGHFNTYKYLTETYSGKDMSLLFKNTMRKHGYEKVKTACWNNRPAYWRRNDSDLSIFFNDL